MNEQPLATLLKTFPHTRYHPEWRLLTWHPRGLFDDALADKLIEVIGSEERVEKVPFHRYADFSGLTHIRLKVGHVFDVAKLRRGVRARSGGADGTNGLCRQGGDDRWVRFGCSARPISGYRSKDVYRWPRRDRLREGSWARYVEDFQKHGSFQSR